MEQSIQVRVRTAEMIALAFLSFFLLLCLLELVLRPQINRAFILCAGVLFFSSSSVFGISEENLCWDMGRWSKTMKAYMALFAAFLLLITVNMVRFTG